MTSARKLVQSSGKVWPEVQRNTREPYNQDVIKSVIEFYEDESVSYCTPGVHQYVTVRDESGNKIKEQKNTFTL